MILHRRFLAHRGACFLGLLLMLWLASEQSFAATAVGRVVFALGQPQATDLSGAVRALKKGDEVFSGDTLINNKGRLQISFIDGGFISVQPNSEYQIENYHYAGKPDGTEQAIYRLLKGGVRAITGLIGKKNRDAYKVHTAVATIGIRGTGHNTRICQGDCPGRQDGLYHNTWEGITYVVNDVDSVDVPTGRGVYVQSLESLIQFLDQPAAVTAVDTGRERQEQQEQNEEQTTVFLTGDQRNDQGTQTAVAVGSTVLPKGVNPNGGPFDDGFTLVAVEPDLINPTDPNDPVDTTLGINTSVFFNANGEPIGAILTDTKFGNIRTFGTIDLNAMLGGDDPATVAEVNALLALGDPAVIATFQQNPATLAEFTVTGGLSTGRWANGRFLSLEPPGPGVSNPAEVDVLTGFQSLHFVFGQEPPPLPTLGTASYNLINSTNSTSVDGATIGQGATGGFIAVNFGMSTGFINMDVTHNSVNYLVSGNLTIQANNNSIFDQFFNVIASTTNGNSACNPDCLTEIDGAFIGPGIGTNNTPQYLGLEYDISERNDTATGATIGPGAEITGVAGFETNPSLIQVLTPQQQLLATTITGVSIPGTLPFINQLADVVLTGDPPTSVASLVQANFAPSALPDILTRVTAQNFDTFNDGTLFITRWSGGTITDVFNNGAPNTFALTADQGVHFAFGIPTTSVPSSGQGTYNFINGSATQSTHLSGPNNPGDGITGGTIQLDFLSAVALPTINVLHDGDNFVLTDPSGLPFQTLAGSTTTQTGFFGTGIAASPIICSSPCNVDIGATFAGDSSSTIGNVPAEIGVVFKVFTTDPFTGAGGFGLSSVTP
ncbi:MAG: FecR domain-containing protein [Gammaproteobacteria bacterium]